MRVMRVETRDEQVKAVWAVSQGPYQRWQQRVDRVRRTPIMDVARYIGCGTFEEVGQEWNCCCPFHNDTNPSFFVNAQKNVFFCHGCGVGGDSIALYMRGAGISFKDAVREMSERF